MRLNEITYTNAQPVDGYGPGFFRIGGQVYNGTIVTGPTGTSAWGGYSEVDALLALSDHIDVLFIGTGKDLIHIPADLRDALEGAGLGVEIMNSPAACRTYNVLLSEGRRVALALIPV
ncbi:Mth938-like domain-containing protein [uncultured Ruegeria sp.]|uniref:Mth938-like domain-containing protein n=1 Tax=uncultured Ruegeria sp. TaxID=259304 RepID=UPI00261B4A80|nr:Mth938-like domain-containing protein [uncultured Ruegeria sp.]